MSEFLAMGGYGFFVWTSYGIAAVILLMNLIIACRKNRQVIKTLIQKKKSS